LEKLAGSQKLIEREKGLFAVADAVRSCFAELFLTNVLAVCGHDVTTVSSMQLEWHQSLPQSTSSMHCLIVS